jgi:hypothetical protein
MLGAWMEGIIIVKREAFSLPKLHAMKTYRIVEVKLHIYYRPQCRMEVSGYLHALNHFTLEKYVLSIHWIGGWVDPTAALNMVTKKKNLSHQESCHNFLYHSQSHNDFNYN